MNEENKEEGKIKIVLYPILRLIFFLPRLVLSNKKLLVILLVIAAVVATVIVARTKPELLGIPKSQQIIESQEEITKLVEEVGRIMTLPEGQTPTIATVTDVEKVKNQNFFSKAQNGDKVLVYTEAKRAILYRPSEKKIIEVGVVNIGDENVNNKEGQDETQGSPTPSVKPTSTPSSTPTPKPTSSPTSTLTPTIIP